MKAHGIMTAAALLGGWNEWKSAGEPVEVTKIK
jgi:3-mercaptopyruvate sulfurtransferase SseA